MPSAPGSRGSHSARQRVRGKRYSGAKLWQNVHAYCLEEFESFAGEPFSKWAEWFAPMMDGAGSSEHPNQVRARHLLAELERDARQLAATIEAASTFYGEQAHVGGPVLPYLAHWVRGQGAFGALRAALHGGADKGVVALLGGGSVVPRPWRTGRQRLIEVLDGTDVFSLGTRSEPSGALVMAIRLKDRQIAIVSLLCGYKPTGLENASDTLVREVIDAEESTIRKAREKMLGRGHNKRMKRLRELRKRFETEAPELVGFEDLYVNSED